MILIPTSRGVDNDIATFVAELRANQAIPAKTRQAATKLLESGADIKVLIKDPSTGAATLERVGTAHAFNPKSGVIVRVITKRDAKVLNSGVDEKFIEHAWQLVRRFAKQLASPRLTYLARPRRVTRL